MWGCAIVVVRAHLQKQIVLPFVCSTPVIQVRFFFFSCCIASAQIPNNCQGPTELQRRLQTDKSPATYNALGTWFASHDKNACAISAFESATAADGSQWEPWYNLGVAYARTGAAERAVESLRRAIKIDPDLAQVHDVLARS